jgi:hypothetical protein
MKQTRKTASLLAQKIDRVAFTTYFLGAVAPLVALGVVVDRYALPTLSASRDAPNALAHRR